MKTVTITRDEPKEDEVHLKHMPQISDASIDKLVLNDILDFVSWQDRLKVIKMAVSKLAYGGIIEIRGLDLLDMSRGIFTMDVSIVEAQSILFQQRESSDTIINIVQTLSSVDLTILRTMLEDYTYYVQAQREEYDD